MQPIQPIVLLADSQLLFWRPEGEMSLMTRVRDWIDTPEPKASYLGASNGDVPAFYEIFVGAMKQIGVHDCRHIKAKPLLSDWDFFAESDIVLLAGGDVQNGWQTFEKNGMKQAILERYHGGALLIGVSAGAIQLGECGHDWATDGQEPDGDFDHSFGLVPALIDAHQEPKWERLEADLYKATRPTRGLGIPSGGGAIFHPDQTLEPVRRTISEFVVVEDLLQTRLLLPPDPSDSEGDTDAATERDLLLS